MVFIFIQDAETFYGLVSENNEETVDYGLNESCR